MEFRKRYASPFGCVTLASDGEALTGLWFDGQRFSEAGAQKERKEDPLPVFERAAEWLDVYFGGLEPDFTPPLRLIGTPFRIAVWKLLLMIPYGSVVSYGEIAARLAAQTGRAVIAPQAVGGAVGHNPISLIVPCHRVIGADGSLTGYACGVDLKEKLLALEGADILRFRK